jgi:3-oxoacyl-[acyl-carrier protein] reductase
MTLNNLKFNKKKIIFITGSSRGIGLDIALNLMKNNNTVIINSRNENKLKNIKKKYPLLDYICGDLSNINNSKKVSKKILNKYKKIDVLICNIGESKSCKPTKETYKEWISMFHQNFFSASNIIESFQKGLIKTKGKIICICAGAGSKFVKGAPITYSTAKAALLFYAKSLAYYLGKEGVRVNIISPGNTLFKGSTWYKKIKKNPNYVKKLIKETVPLNTFAKTQDIADMVDFLISKKSSFINGANITIDGGQTI